VIVWLHVPLGVVIEVTTTLDPIGACGMPCIA
jgi:hypothetical protein